MISSPLVFKITSQPLNKARPKAPATDQYAAYDQNSDIGDDIADQYIAGPTTEAAMENWRGKQRRDPATGAFIDRRQGEAEGPNPLEGLSTAQIQALPYKPFLGFTDPNESRAGAQRAQRQRPVGMPSGTKQPHELMSFPLAELQHQSTPGAGVTYDHAFSEYHPAGDFESGIYVHPATRERFFVKKGLTDPDIKAQLPTGSSARHEYTVHRLYEMFANPQNGIRPVKGTLHSDAHGGAAVPHNYTWDYDDPAYSVLPEISANTALQYMNAYDMPGYRHLRRGLTDGIVVDALLGHNDLYENPGNFMGHKDEPGVYRIDTGYHMGMSAFGGEYPTTFWDPKHLDQVDILPSLVDLFPENAKTRYPDLPSHEADTKFAEDILDQARDAIETYDANRDNLSDIVRHHHRAGDNDYGASLEEVLDSRIDCLRRMVEKYKDNPELLGRQLLLIHSTVGNITNRRHNATLPGMGIQRIMAQRDPFAALFGGFGGDDDDAEGWEDDEDDGDDDSEDDDESQDPVASHPDLVHAQNVLAAQPAESKNTTQSLRNKKAFEHAFAQVVGTANMRNQGNFPAPIRREFEEANELSKYIVDPQYVVSAVNKILNREFYRRGQRAGKPNSVADGEQLPDDFYARMGQSWGREVMRMIRARQRQAAWQDRAAQGGTGIEPGEWRFGSRLQGNEGLDADIDQWKSGNNPENWRFMNDPAMPDGVFNRNVPVNEESPEQWADRRRKVAQRKGRARDRRQQFKDMLDQMYEEPNAEEEYGPREGEYGTAAAANARRGTLAWLSGENARHLPRLGYDRSGAKTKKMADQDPEDYRAARRGRVEKVRSRKEQLERARQRRAAWMRAAAEAGLDVKNPLAGEPKPIEQTIPGEDSAPLRLYTRGTNRMRVDTNPWLSQPILDEHGRPVARGMLNNAPGASRQLIAEETPEEWVKRRKEKRQKILNIRAQREKLIHDLLENWDPKNDADPRFPIDPEGKIGPAFPVGLNGFYDENGNILPGAAQRLKLLMPNTVEIANPELFPNAGNQSIPNAQELLDARRQAMEQARQEKLRLLQRLANQRRAAPSRRK